jgi:hypothetical protein
MATAEALMGVGLPAEQAKRLGVAVQALTAVGTAQGGAPIPAYGGNLVINLTTAGGQTATTLPALAGLGDEVEINVITATAALVFPPTGGTIANKALNASATVAIGARFRKVSTTLWAAVGAA